MNKEIENIIKKNLPEKKEIKKEPEPKNEEDWDIHCGKIWGFNQALSQINTSLIADEVLRVVRMNLNDNFYDEWKKVKEDWWTNSMKKNNNNYDPAIGEIEQWFYYKTQESIRNIIINNL